MNQTLAAARQAGIHIIFAPSDVTGFYAKDPARLGQYLIVTPVRVNLKIEIINYTDNP